ncbi:hypothetical protein [Herminiimonas sp. KBW02]|uniref:hypothetical protein n=1 Tax=Herminiimonas sp. KBW02 TaxID=2153363 RepID=UPI001F1A4D77|nr:hypothetical protein [Herminiimonas sp. KBW02]
MQVTVSNHGAEPEYVSVTLSRLQNPGVPLEDEQLQAVSETASPTLYATPFRMTLLPGQSKPITLKPLSEISTEQVYRLDVRPEVANMRTGRSGRVGMVVIKIAHSGIVRQLPRRQHQAMQVLCSADGARILATGNVRHRIEGAAIDGEVLEAFNVYPGTPRTLIGQHITVPGYPACTATPP